MSLKKPSQIFNSIMPSYYNIIYIYSYKLHVPAVLRIPRILYFVFYSILYSRFLKKNTKKNIKIERCLVTNIRPEDLLHI